MPAFAPGVRGFRDEDAPAILAAMLAAQDRDEFEGLDRHWMEESVARMREQPGLVAVAEDEGRVAGWVFPRHDDLHVDLPFRRRGHGRRLIQAGRLLAPANGYDRLRLWVPHRPVAEAFARGVGLNYHSSLYRLQLDPDAAADVPAPVFEPAWTIRWLIPGQDEPAFVDLVNEIFLDHPSPLVLDLAQIQAVHARAGFDPTSILLVSPSDAPDELAGFCRVGKYTDDDETLVGEVRLLGVRRPWRGRGLARALVRWGVAACRERGVGRIYLAAEGDNERAVGLYESEGFRRIVEWPHWVAPPLAPGEAGAAGSGAA